MENSKVTTKIFTKEFSKYFKNLSYKDGISGVDGNLKELIAESIGISTNQRILLLNEEESKKEKKREEEETKEGIKNLNISLEVGGEVDEKRLIDLGYTRVERVWNEGEFSVLGDIWIIWPYSLKNVVRVSVFEDEIENIDIVDSESRKKISSVKKKEISLAGTDVVVGNEQAEKTQEILITNSLEQEATSLNIKEITNLISLKYYKQKKFKIWYLTNNLEKIEKGDEKLLKDVDTIFESHGNIEKEINRGFVFLEKNIVVLTDYEILGEVDLSQYQDVDNNIDPGSVEILKKIIPGDYIVHEDHGIGVFKGLKSKEEEQYLEIQYAGKDRLLVPLNVANKLTKYIGAGKARPKLTGLNSGIWNRISTKAKKHAYEIAKELLQLYALREVSDIELLFDSEQSLDEYWKFANDFEFEDTEDQLLATRQILEDYQNGKPMDRLLVGDVGFGKTEIAMRAMFPVVNAQKQVAMLAPTTILVQQHVEVLKKRFEKYAFNIVGLSRFTTEDEKEKILKGLKNGTIDIVVGTHSLLSNSIEFKDLGLLVIDEEQKFGVKQKEKIKTARLNTNVLSLTATPIPRTLNMALSGIRDISVLATPPSGRKDIKNVFSKFNWEDIEIGIKKELDRGGQVYFLHNRVGTISNISDKLSNLFPQHKIDIAHGQMGVQKLSEAMTDFVKGDTDILICTTIIENGLDIPNVNTLIVDDATMLGLSQMYQIRGRVGRSSKQAYAYFYYNKLVGDSELRLSALKESQALGSGFVLSNRDLEIRGAGDILGKSQSGAINTVGYGLYTQMLAEAVDEIKENFSNKEIENIEIILP